VKNATQELQFLEPNVAHLSAPALLSDHPVGKLSTSARRDPNVVDHSRVVSWFVMQDYRSLSELDAVEEDSFPRKLARLMVLAPNKKY